MSNYHKFFWVFISVSLLTFSCRNKDSIDNISPESGAPYPKGFKKVGLTGQTNCELDRCDPNRTIILVADQAEGILSGGLDSLTQVESFSIRTSIAIGDATIDCFICDITDEVRQFNGKKVRFSGECRDGCRTLQPIISGQERYACVITSLDTIP